MRMQTMYCHVMLAVAPGDYVENILPSNSTKSFVLIIAVSEHVTGRWRVWYIDVHGKIDWAWDIWFDLDIKTTDA